MNPPEPRTDSADFAPPADDPLRKAPDVDDMEARRARSAIEGRLFSGPAQRIRVGRYRIEGRIGAGGMGVVYRAHDPELARDVAVKLMHPDAAEGAQERTARARLIREARAMARLAHPNVIHVYDVGAVDDGVFIAMELVDGTSLASWHRAEPRNWRSVLAVCLDAGRGLAAAHEAGVVHRDFKPENVLVGADGRARVGDFGLAGGAVPTTGAHAQPSALHRTDGLPADDATAATLDDAGGRDVLAALDAASDDDSALGPAAPIGEALTRTGMLLGTPKYMAPEQEVGGTASPLADQFSFCVALFEALYGHPPFAGDSVAEYRKSVHAERFVPPPSDTKVKAWVHTQILKGLAVNPTERHASMHELIERLETALSDPSAARRRRRRRRGIVLGVAAVGLVGAAGIALAWATGPDAADAAAATPVAAAAPSSPEAEPGGTPSPAVRAADPGPPHAVIPEHPPTPADRADAPTADPPPVSPPPADDGAAPEGSSPGPAPTEVRAPAAAPRPSTDASSDGARPEAPKGSGREKPARRDARKKDARKDASRGYCYFKQDSSVHMTDRKHKKEFLAHGGQCYQCVKGRPNVEYNPSDCRGFLDCYVVSDASKCES